jgi:hypothetical protein
VTSSSDAWRAAACASIRTVDRGDDARLAAVLRRWPDLGGAIG